MIVPQSPGIAYLDASARIVAERMRGSLKQPIRTGSEMEDDEKQAAALSQKIIALLKAATSVSSSR
jgi:hypothetical protein